MASFTSCMMLTLLFHSCKYTTSVLYDSLHPIDPPRIYWSVLCSHYLSWPWTSAASALLWSSRLNLLLRRLNRKSRWRMWRMWGLDPDVSVSSELLRSPEVFLCDTSIYTCIHAYGICVCMLVSVCARACTCGHTYRSVRPALPPSVPGQAPHTLTLLVHTLVSGLVLPNPRTFMCFYTRVLVWSLWRLSSIMSSSILYWHWYYIL